MIVLNNGDTVQVLLAADPTTTQPACFASFTDETPGKPNVNGRALSKSNGLTPVDLVPTPAANASRVVQHISVVNGDTASSTVTVRLKSGSNTYDLAKFTLGVNEKLEYTSANGFRVFANSGAIKQSINQGK